MMKYLFTIILFFILYSGTAQEILKQRAESVAFKFQNDDSSWKDWTDWEETSVLTMFNFRDMRITLYSNPKEIYDIISTETGEPNKNGDVNIIDREYGFVPDVYWKKLIFKL